VQIRLGVSRKRRRFINLRGFAYQKFADIMVNATATANLTDDHDDDDDNNNSKFRQYLSNITGEREIKELQNTAILGTAKKLQRVLLYKCKIYFTGGITMHVAFKLIVPCIIIQY